MLLKIVGLSKKINKKTVLNKINFSINQGEIVGLIGPNGSGKTTLLNILMGIIKPTAGAFTVSDNSKLGMSVSRRGFFDDMTVAKNIMLYAKLLQVKESELTNLIDRFTIDYGQVQFGKLSAGMKQRVSLMMAFVGDPTLVFLDEPSNHLDIDSILILRKVLLDSRAFGTSFLITSHILSDLEKVCDRILFMKNGTIMKDASTTELLKAYENLEDAYVSILKTNQHT